MATARKITLKCGYCQEQGDCITDPRSLPCSHVHCYPCLVKNFDTNWIIRCGKCRETFDATQTVLSCATTEASDSHLCDVCVEKERVAELAVSFCGSCERKMCAKHDEIHQDFLPKHSNVMMMENFKPNIGCSSETAANDEIFSILKSKAMEVKADTKARDEKLSSLLRHCTKVLTDYEMETAKMINLMHNTRDKQLTEVKSKYSKLEKGLRERRRRTRDAIIDFIDRQADVMSNLTEATKEWRDFINKRLPTLTSAGSVEGKCEDTESNMVERVSVPTSLKLQKEIKLDDWCSSISSCEGVTCVVSGQRTVSIIGERDYTQTRCVSLGSGTLINDVCVYAGRLYLLVHPWSVQVHDFHRTLLTSWEHSDSCTAHNRLTVSADRVVVPDNSNKRLAVYSLDGHFIRHITSLEDCKWTQVTICAANNQCVIVSSVSANAVYKVNIDTGEIIWTCTEVNLPLDVTRYGESYVIVVPAQTIDVEIFILDINTGKCVGKLVDPKECSVCGVCGTGNTLAVTRYDQKSVLYYELING